MKNSPLSPDLISLSHRLADAAGEVIRKYFRADFSIDSKSDDSPVTIADREAEKAIRAILEKERPGDGIHGEEFGSDAGKTGYLWVLDPVDGTKSFATGRTLFGTLIGLAHEGEAVLGVIDQPIVKERWIGAKGHGATFNGKPCKTRACQDLSSAHLATTGPGPSWEDFSRFHHEVAKKSGFTVYGGDCYAYAQVASGWLDGVVEEGLKLHDYAALIPIIEGAGGIITDWKGKPLTLEATWNSSAVIAAGDKTLHEKLRDALSL